MLTSPATTRPARWLAAACALLAAGCRYGEMYDQPRYEAYEASSFFGDGLAMRTPEPGTVPRYPPGPGSDDPAFRTGRGADGAFVDELPIRLDAAVLERGRQRYQIYCMPCHGIDGAGRGPIVLRGFSPPPALYRPDVAQQPLGYYFDVITNGHGAMYGYAARVPVLDRWKIAAYLRALQMSQNATPEMLTDQDFQALADAAREAAGAGTEAGESPAEQQRAAESRRPGTAPPDPKADRRVGEPES
jgi:mono/diheme cytochrome c family protein